MNSIIASVCKKFWFSLDKLGFSLVWHGLVWFDILDFGSVWFGLVRSRLV